MSSVLDRLERLEKAMELMIGKAKTDHNHVGMLHDENEALSLVYGDAYLVILRRNETDIALIKQSIKELIIKLNEVILYVNNR